MYIGQLTSKLRISAGKRTDDRLQITQETLTAMKIIKMYAWESYFSGQITKARKEEIERIKKIYYSKVASLIVGGLILNISLYIIVMVYTSQGNNLTAEVTFYIMSCLHVLRSTCTISIPLGIAQTAELVASAKRINKLLNGKEIRITKRGLHWSKPFVMLDNVSVKVKDIQILHNITLKISDTFNMITGRLGGGKSSLLKTILEDYQISEGNMKIQGRMSYASEEPWLFPSSIKQNILFGQHLDEQRYQKVLEVCALKMDISTFESGDNTIIDDRGMNLSKGQQSRINLARAVYNDVDIYLIDDCLSSLDSHVQDFVFQECIKKFLKDKMVIMISNNAKHIQEADNVIFIEQGTVKSTGKPSEIPEAQIVVQDEDKEEMKEFDIIDKISIGEENNTENVTEEDESDLHETNKLIQVKAPITNIYHEEKKQGKIEKDVYKKYCHYGGGFCILFGIVVLFIVAQAALNYSEKLVSTW